MRPMMLLAATLMCSNFACTQNTPTTNITKQEKNVGGHCEGCEAVNESPLPFSKLSSSVNLPDYNEKGPKLLVQGTVYKNDGKTPAPDVVLYVYHTNQKGIYPRKENEKGWAKRHGHIRGWLKTGTNGQYSFYTLKPAAYPNGNIAAHIHIFIKEPDLNPYWIDEFVFDDDPLLSKEQRKQTQNRGGSGILLLESKNGLLVGERDIILGKNIENYQP